MNRMKRGGVWAVWVPRPLPLASTPPLHLVVMDTSKLILFHCCTIAEWINRWASRANQPFIKAISNPYTKWSTFAIESGRIGSGWMKRRRVQFQTGGGGWGGHAHSSFLFFNGLVIQMQVSQFATALSYESMKVQQSADAVFKCQLLIRFDFVQWMEGKRNKLKVYQKKWISIRHIHSSTTKRSEIQTLVENPIRFYYI